MNYVIDYFYFLKRDIFHYISTISSQFFCFVKIFNYSPKLAFFILINNNLYDLRRYASNNLSLSEMMLQDHCLLSSINYLHSKYKIPVIVNVPLKIKENLKLKLTTFKYNGIDIKFAEYSEDLRKIGTDLNTCTSSSNHIQKIIDGAYCYLFSEFNNKVKFAIKIHNTGKIEGFSKNHLVLPESFIEGVLKELKNTLLPNLPVNQLSISPHGGHFRIPKYKDLSSIYKEFKIKMTP